MKIIYTDNYVLTFTPNYLNWKIFRLDTMYTKNYVCQKLWKIKKNYVH